MDQLHADCERVAHQYLIDTVDNAIRDLVDNGIMDIDEERFLSQHLPSHLSWASDYQVINEKYMEIVLTAEQLDEYRESRRINSPGFIGGGFGIQGAAQGMAVAAAANVAIGVAHGIFNAGATVLSTIGDIHKKSMLYKDSNTIEHLSASIYRLVFQVHLTIVDIVNARHPTKVFYDVSSEDLAASNGLQENVSKGRITGDKSASILIEAMTLNPYEPSLYDLWLERFGDADCKLEDAANYFGIATLPERKRAMVSRRMDGVSLMDNEELDAYLSEIILYAQSLGIKNANHIISDICATTKKESLIKKRDAYISKCIQNGWRVTNISKTSFTITDRSFSLSILKFIAWLCLLFMMMVFLALPFGIVSKAFFMLIVFSAAIYHFRQWRGITLVGSMDYEKGNIYVTKKGEAYKTL